MADVRRIVVVCGYGCNLDSPLRPYLDRVKQFCLDRRPIGIILCGGVTQRKSFPGLAEATVMYDFLFKDVAHADPAFYKPRWAVLSGSYTTYDNIRDAADAVERFKAWAGPGDYEITIFCEATRALKVAILARHFMGFPPARGERDIRIETDSWERMHPTQELIGTLKDWLATKVPYVNELQRRQRILKSENR